MGIFNASLARGHLQAETLRLRPNSWCPPLAVFARGERMVRLGPISPTTPPIRSRLGQQNEIVGRPETETRLW